MDGRFLRESVDSNIKTVSRIDGLHHWDTAIKHLKAGEHRIWAFVV